MIILATGNNVSVVVRDGDLVRGDKTFYCFYNAGYYDPRNEFKPCFEGAELRRRLYDKYVEEYKGLLGQAQAQYERIVASYEKAFAKKAPAAPAQPDRGSFGDQLQDMMLKVLAEQSTGKVLEMAKPMLEQHIKETFGMLPRVHEVKTPAHTVKIEGVVHEKFDEVVGLVAADIPVFLTGAAGTGKNVICKQAAKALNLEFYFSNAVTQEYKLTGFIDANGKFHETQFYKAFTEGGLFMLDEMDASIPEVLIILNAAIANRYFDFPTGRVEAHENFRVIAAGNTFGTGADMEYTGRFQLDAASLDRFALVEIDYSRNIEEAISGGDIELVDYVRSFRKACYEAGLKHLATYRSIERIHKLDGLMDLKEVIRICLIKSMSKDDLNVIHRSISNDIGTANKYVKAEYSILKNMRAA